MNRSPIENVPKQSFIEFLNDLGYTRIKVMEGDILCGIQRQLFTWALVVGIDRVGYRRRYCYEREYDAREALVQWDGKGDPTGPWIKEKPSDRLGPGATSA